MSNSDKESVELNSNVTEPDQEEKGLSFFTADDNDSSSESDSDEERFKTTAKEAEGNGSVEGDPKDKLPSPSTLFATVGKPKFLDRPLEDEDVDWNSLSKRYEPLFEYSSVSYPAETVDLSSAERTEASVSGAPVKYKREISETTRHMFLHGKRSVDMSNMTDGTSVAGTAQGMRKIELMGGITLEKCELWVLSAGDHNHRINNQPEVRLRVGTFDVGVLVHVTSRISSSPSIRQVPQAVFTAGFFCI